MRYKRNQVEEAVVRTLGAEGSRVDELKLRMKRLLVTDRRLGRGKRSDDKAALQLRRAESENDFRLYDN